MDFPFMAGEGERLNPEMHWHSDEHCLSRRYDLVLASGVIQCMRDWRQQLPRIAGAAQKYFLLTRTPVVARGPGYVAVLRTDDTEALHEQFSEEELLEVVCSAGFRLVREMVVGDRIDIHDAPEPCEFRGWLFQRT